MRAERGKLLEASLHGIGRFYEGEEFAILARRRTNEGDWWYELPRAVRGAGFRYNVLRLVEARLPGGLRAAIFSMPLLVVNRLDDGSLDPDFLTKVVGWAARVDREEIVFHRPADGLTRLLGVGVASEKAGHVIDEGPFAPVAAWYFWRLLGSARTGPDDLVLVKYDDPPDNHISGFGRSADGQRGPSERLYDAIERSVEFIDGLEWQTGIRARYGHQPEPDPLVFRIRSKALVFRPGEKG